MLYCVALFVVLFDHVIMLSVSQGLKAPEDGEQREAVNLAINWKHKLYKQRTIEAISAPRGARGLRKLNRSHISTPSLVDVLQPKMAL